MTNGPRTDEGDQPVVTGDRERDPAGRPRNARPRDELGRPLPRTGGTPGPGAIGEELTIGPAEAAETGGGLLLAGRPFHAHEVFEAAWKSATGADRDLWRGLAQVAVGLTHARRGNERGAVALLRRGAARLSDYDAHAGPGAGGYGIDARYVITASRALAARIEQAGLTAIVPGDLLLPLRPDASTEP
jgi:hypothetical protein